MTDRADPPRADALAALLTADLPAFPLPHVHAADLSPQEQHALAASGGPDLCLIDAPPGTDRPAFAAAAALEAVRRGERVAVLCGSPADADAVLHRLLDADLLVGRAAGPGEDPDPDHGATAHVADLLVARRRLTDQLDRAVAARTATEAAADAVPQLRVLAARLADQSQLADKLKADPLGVPDDARDAELAALDAAHAADQAKATAKPGGLFGAVKGLFGKPAAKSADADGAYQHARDQLVADGAARRLAELLAQQAEALEQFRAAGRVVAAAGLAAPAGPTAAAVEPVADAVSRAMVEVITAVADAEAAVARFDADRPRRERELCGAVPAVVGAAAACGADPLLAGPFDRLIVPAADGLDDAALNRAAALAARWVLLGSAASPAPHRNGKSGTFLRPTLFRRLWDRHATAEVWAADGVLLVATLAPHDPEAVRCEPLADRADVELRFTPTGDLAAVAFPPTATLAEAKSLLAADLGLVALAGCGPHVWHDDPDRLAVCWPAVEADAGDWADLGDGVRELVCGTGPDGLTAAVGFERGRWTREAAEAWLADHLPAGRAVRLPAPALVAG